MKALRVVLGVVLFSFAATGTAAFGDNISKAAAEEAAIAADGRLLASEEVSFETKIRPALGLAALSQGFGGPTIPVLAIRYSTLLVAPSGVLAPSRPGNRHSSQTIALMRKLRGHVEAWKAANGVASVDASLLAASPLGVDLTALVLVFLEDPKRM